MMNTCQDRGDVQWVMYLLEVDEIGGLCERIRKNTFVPGSPRVL